MNETIAYNILLFFQIGFVNKRKINEGINPNKYPPVNPNS